MHNKEIKPFYLEGIISDHNLPVTKERLILNMESDMRDKGFVPALDLDPLFSVDYKAEKEHFEFQLTVYGIFVGKDEAWNLGGVMNGKRIPRYTAQTK